MPNLNVAAFGFFTDMLAVADMLTVADADANEVSIRRLFMVIEFIQICGSFTLNTVKARMRISMPTTTMVARQQLQQSMRRRLRSSLATGSLPKSWAVVGEATAGAKGFESSLPAILDW